MRYKDLCPSCKNHDLKCIHANIYECSNCGFREIQNLTKHLNYKNTTIKPILTHRSKKEKQKTKMITEEKGDYTKYKPSKDFKCKCMMSTPYKSAPKEITINKGTDKEKQKTIHNYGVYIINPNNEEDKIFLTLTYSLYATLDKYCNNGGDLNEKILNFEERKHPEYTNLLKVSVLE